MTIFQSGYMNNLKLKSNYFIYVRIEFISLRIKLYQIDRRYEIRYCEQENLMNLVLTTPTLTYNYMQLFSVLSSLQSPLYIQLL